MYTIVFGVVYICVHRINAKSVSFAMASMDSWLLARSMHLPRICVKEILKPIYSVHGRDLMRLLPSLILLGTWEHYQLLKGTFDFSSHLARVIYMARMIWIFKILFKKKIVQYIYYLYNIFQNRIQTSHPQTAHTPINQTNQVVRASPLRLLHRPQNPYMHATANINYVASADSGKI